MALLFAFAFTVIGTFGNPDPAAAWSAGSFDSGSEQELLALHNRARASAGRKAVRWDAALGAIARSRSQDMIQRNYFDHTILGSGRHVWDLMTDRNYCYTLAGENIGWNQNWPDDQATVEINRSFMGSPGHRDNILGPAWDVVGIGAFKGADGKVMWTVVFADTCTGAPSTSTPAAPAAPAAPATTPAPAATPAPAPAAPAVAIPSSTGPRPTPQVFASVVTVPTANRVVTWRWTATAPTPARRACSFDLLYRDNLGPWKLLRSRTTTRAISIQRRTPGHTYTLRVRARDCAGSLGQWSDPRVVEVS